MRFYSKTFTVVSFIFSVMLFVSCEKEDISTENYKETGIESSKETSLIKYLGAMIRAEELTDGQYMIGGDMIVTPDQENDNKSYSSAGVGLWPNGVVKYMISQQFKDEDAKVRPHPFKNYDMKKMLEDAMSTWTTATGVSFVEVDSSTPRREYIEILWGSSNSSVVGYNSPFPKKFKISDQAHQGVYLHELGHTLGLLHEQQRVDRDDYIIIHSDYINDSAYEKFTANPILDYHTPSLDFNSVMLYPSTEYRGDYNVKKTNGQPFTSGYATGVLSQGDINTVKAMYSGGNNCNTSGNLPNDVSCDHWAFNEIKFMWQNGYIVGNGTSFDPDGILNRAQFAALVAKVINPEPIRDARNFADVPASPNRHWAYDAISKTYRGGYMSGISNTLFNPNGRLTKEQLVVAIASGKRLSGGNNNHLRLFSDQSSISSWAIEKVKHAIANRYVTNYPDKDKFRAQSPVTRAEAAMIFYQVLVDQNIAPSINNPYLLIP
ncbi:M12 family metallopeptidase [uncultured Aquimarina sp.]|uniref:M12 family metallopeptidase n=1 Tax=uncultured Aquimarina sp. TaxID=575652 RepID=UPI00261D9597|nr:M12 family metallopeptidase [uncultured Aquimarina sp.]